MKLKFLGTGSAFTYGDHNYQSNMIIIAPNGKKLLIDCGTDIRFSLGEQGIHIKEIDAVYISHAHADHIGGLEFLGFSTYFNPELPKPTMFINTELSDLLWHHSLKGGMGSLEGRISILDDYFDVIRIPQNGYFIWENTRFQLVRVVHYMHGFDLAPSYGLWINLPGHSATYFITTDVQFAPRQIAYFYEHATVIFQDCETSLYASGVHAHFNELNTLPDLIKNKMWLYHYQPGKLPCAKEAGFLGFIRKGQEFDLNDPFSIIKENL